MQKLRWLAILMGITILGITGFQLYWLKNNYDREKQNLDIKTNLAFRQTILRLQSSKMKLDRINLKFNESLSQPPGIKIRPGRRGNFHDSAFNGGKESAITMLNLLQEKMKSSEGDSGRKKAFIFSTSDSFINNIYGDSLVAGNHFHGNVKTIAIATSSDSFLAPGFVKEIRLNKDSKGTRGGKKTISINYDGKRGNKQKKDSVTVRSPGIFVERSLPVTEDIVEHRENVKDPEGNEVFRFLYNVDSLSLKDSVTIKEIADAYVTKLKENKMKLEFAVTRLDSSTVESQALNEVSVGFVKPMVFRLDLKNEMSYILKQLSLPILFSLFLIGITIASFILLYRSLLQQRRLAVLKNEFISNITHELKTPIATVGVAIEALKNFNAIHDPERTREYLDISQNELQRLSLLVDKVLKLSMFENKEMELKKEQFDCKQLVSEIMNSMRLQFEKYHAKVKLHTEGDSFIVEADKLHITSVIYNLLDNALKYGKENPVIDVQLKSYPQNIELSVRDNGIGIEPAFKEKIFDKFFRVPTGNRHDIKGYGLGLSYVAEVIKRHQGNISVESEPGKGSTFTAKFPYAGAR
jgi:two-component system phosphate regulon sensor histidine kinase PhoR